MVGGIQNGTVGLYQNTQNIGGNAGVAQQQNERVQEQQKLAESLRAEEQNQSNNDSANLNLQAQANQESGANNGQRGNLVDISV
jgi:hypothetical protein